MNFQTSLQTCLTQKYASFQGRASRSEYWWFVLAYVIGAVVIAILGVRLLSIVYTLALLVPLASAGWRRLQDTGRPGWYILIPIALSVVSTLTAPPMPRGAGMDMDGGMPGGAGMGGGLGLMALLGIVQLILAVLYIYWLSRPSQPEVNAYGPPPAA